MDAEAYDLVVLGSGEGGKYLAWTLAKQGQRVAVIERKYIGGSCPNIACLPSKNIIHSAKVASYFFREARNSASPRTIAKSTWRPCATANARWSMAWSICISPTIKASGAELIMGSGRFVGPKTIEVALAGGGTRLLHGKEGRHRHRHPGDH